MPASWAIERLARRHDRSQFDCGHGLLNDWLKQRASQFDRRDLARTYVAVESGQTTVLGYYAVSGHHVRFALLPDEEAKGLPRLDVPVMLLGRLAVDLRTQGQGLGSFLLIDALRRAQHLAETLGIRAVEVDAIDAAARSFYLKYGFFPLKDDAHHLFLPMQTIRQLRLPPL
ncbi:MAG TPA: GNAT family N-acetyltransferase [Pirellulaceae bacterium]|nr:GNAT family N-acetyltransferase [Pirellulaceae bacterium]